ncbi:MAG: phage terminase large subunit family protein [Lachnospiraceae bacterium]|nr:phage terminase large subunit family protein [Lachnospiraceae bacterium]
MSLTLPEKLTVSQWAEKYRILDASSNIEGHWSNDITPYLVGIMDTYLEQNVREIYFCKSTQIGGTEALINILGYIIMMSPAPTMIVYPNDELAKDISSKRLRPAMRLIPEIRKNFQETRSKELLLQFRNMPLYLRGAGSPAKLASVAIKYLFFDEIDKMGGASKKEASPYSLAMERIKTYKNQSKVYACSTPTLRDNYIWKLHDNADEVRHFFVPCPHCGKYIELIFKQILYDKDPEKKLSPYERAQTSKYVCPECGCVIQDADKPNMLRQGEWRAVKKRGIGKPKTVGFWINSLYSVFVTWADVAEQFLKSKDDPEELQNFSNSWLAEPWEDTKLKTSADLVMERQTECEEYELPEWTKLITGGVDVQENCFYWTIRAWGTYMTSQNIAHGQAYTFKEIEQIMNLEFRMPDGTQMIVAMTLIDSGNDADLVYDFCANNSEWALPCKGSSNPMLSHYKLSKVNKINSSAYGMPLVLVDGGKYKDMIAGRMRRPNGTGAWMVYKNCDLEYAEQVTAEHKVNVRTGNGKKKLAWVLKSSHKDNHYLDCEVYAAAAADMMGVRTLHLIETEETGNTEPAEEQVNSEENWIKTNENWI